MTLAKLTTRFDYHPHTVRTAVLGGRLRIIHAAGKPFVLVGLSSDATTDGIEWPLLRKRNGPGLDSRTVSVLPVSASRHQEQRL